MSNDEMATENRGREEGQSPKQLEQLKLLTGVALVIDQFMLANTQFVSQLPTRDGSDAAEWVRAHREALERAAEMYGGVVLEAKPGDWAILRDPQEAYFIFARLSEEDPAFTVGQQKLVEMRGNAVAKGKVFVDTRCLIFMDLGLLFREDFLKEYRRLWEERRDKAARDYLRSQGAVVRYGFDRTRDELDVYIGAANEQFFLCSQRDEIRVGERRGG